MAKGKVTAIGIDISTTAVTGVGYTDKDEIVSASVPMRGATDYFGQPAFIVNKLGMTVNKGERNDGMILEVVNKIEEQAEGLSWKGAICFSVRQHDQILADRNGGPLIPALSWQCNWADDEVDELKAMDIEKSVGPIEPRFILPKVLKTLKEAPGIKNGLYYIMTTGDWIGWLLTGNVYIGTSDALSNSLLYQKNKRLAVKVFRDVGLDPSWFPPPIQSGSFVGLIDPNISGLMSTFEPLAQKLCAWSLYAGLGDNHAGAVGCGLSDFNTIVVSAGSSGTIVRLCHNNATTKDRAVSFEFFDRRMLLMMMADCATRFVRFADQYGEGLTYDQLDSLAPERWGPKFVEALRLDYENAMEALPSLSEKVAYVRYTIASQLGELVYKIRNVVDQRESIRKIIFTGGMMKSGLFRGYLKTYLDFLNLPIYMLEGEIGSKAAPYGALITAMVGSDYFPDLKTATEKMCVLKQI